MHVGVNVYVIVAYMTPKNWNMGGNNVKLNGINLMRIITAGDNLMSPDCSNIAPHVSVLTQWRVLCDQIVTIQLYCLFYPFNSVYGMFSARISHTVHFSLAIIVTLITSTFKQESNKIFYYKASMHYKSFQAARTSCQRWTEMKRDDQRNRDEPKLLKVSIYIFL